MRPGPDTDGSRSQEADSVFATPPGVRETLVREIIAFAYADGQVGFPHTIPSDAPLGYPATAHQSSEILFHHLEKEKFVVARLEGTTSRGHGGTHSELAQHAKVGCCPCCTVASHVAARATYDVGALSNEKVREVFLRKILGPRAACRYAAYVYAQMFGSLRLRGIGRRSLSVWRPRHFLWARICPDM